VVAKAVKSFFENSNYEVDIWDENIFDPTIQRSDSVHQINERLQHKLNILGLAQNRGSFGKGEKPASSPATNLESLKNFSDIYDFAIFIFVPEDKIISQSRVSKTNPQDEAKGEGTRHNVVFEFGLFLGRIGSKKTFIVADHNTKDFINNFFTDLKDIKLYEYQGNYDDWLKSDDLKILPYDKASLQQQVELIKEEIEKTKVEIDLGFLPSTALAIGYFENLLKLVITSLSAMRKGAPNSMLRMEWLDEDKKKNGEIAVDMTGREIKFKMVIPDALIGASHEEYKKEIEQLGLLHTVVPFKTRSFGVFCHPDVLKEGEALTIYDIPSTMFSSSKAIDMLTKVNDIRQLLDEKEKRNFVKAIEYLLNKEKENVDIVGIEKMVSIISIQELKNEFGLGDLTQK